MRWTAILQPSEASAKQIAPTLGFNTFHAAHKIWRLHMPMRGQAMSRGLTKQKVAGMLQSYDTCCHICEGCKSMRAKRLHLTTTCKLQRMD